MSTEAEAVAALNALQACEIDLNSAWRTWDIDQVRDRLDDLIVVARHARRVLADFEGWS